mmetsp:Transcript_9135/g.17073  ORF Transcript_9135/g.17073 Transcript_9135/m.17073 type:complete len:245 (+) Transcript_9135:348-1082(+)
MQHVGVVHLREVVNVDALLLVLLLELQERVHDVLVLYAFVRVVDAQLLEPVHGERLESEHVEDGHPPPPRRVVARGQGGRFHVPIDRLDQLLEHLRVNLLRQSVAPVPRRDGRQGDRDGLPRGRDEAGGKGRGDFSGGNAQDVRQLLEFFRGAHEGSLVARRIGTERYVPELQNGADGPEDRPQPRILAALLESEVDQRRAGLLPVLSVVELVAAAVAHVPKVVERRVPQSRPVQDLLVARRCQ